LIPSNLLYETRVLRLIRIIPTLGRFGVSWSPRRAHSLPNNSYASDPSRRRARPFCDTCRVQFVLQESWRTPVVGFEPPRGIWLCPAWFE
jgi:hypothetical protein